MHPLPSLIDTTTDSNFPIRKVSEECIKKSGVNEGEQMVKEVPNEYQERKQLRILETTHI